MSRRSVDKVVADLLDAVQASSELVGRGREAYESDRMLRLAGEALIGRIGDSASKLRDQLGEEIPEGVPWEDVIANRIIVDHVYHRVDYDSSGTLSSAMCPNSVPRSESGRWIGEWT